MQIWIVDSNKNETLTSNIPGQEKLTRIEIEAFLQNKNIDIIDELYLKNKIVESIYPEGVRKFLLNGTCKYSAGIYWLRAYRVLKDFNNLAPYQKLYLSEYISNLTVIPLDILE